jgi:zinc transporter ZupT
MLALVLTDVGPEARRAGSPRRAWAGALAGGAVMVACALVLGVS